MLFKPGFLFAVIVSTSTALGAESPAAFRFENDTDGWRPRARSVTVARVEGQGATPESKAYLQIKGPIREGWNYAVSDRRPIRAGQLYRLTAWLKVSELGTGSPPPYLKAEIVSPDPKAAGAQFHTEHYDVAKIGQWQQLQVEFQADANSEAIWFALEKGTNSATEIDAFLDEIRLEPIERLSVLEQYRLSPFPADLEKVRGVHPRLYVDAARVDELKAAIRTTHAALWQEVRERADYLVRRGPPAYQERDRYSGDEQLWQREVGNAMPTIAMAWLLTGERKYLESAQAWALASCGYKTWGLGRIDGMDLAAGHQLFGLGIVYDWCHDELDAAARRTIRETIVRRGTAMFEAAATGKAWWRKSYMQNHLWVDACGLSIAGLAVFDEVDDAQLWVGLGLDKFRRSTEALGTDGASHEGVGYWEYGVEYLLKFMDPARQYLDTDLYDRPWWHKTALYPLYLSLPRDAWTRRSSIVDIADCPRSHWYGPDYLLRCLAREYRDPQAQWLAAEVDRAGVTAPGAPWLNLVWFDPGVPATPPTSLPTLHYFDDLGIVSARSDWSGRESLVVLKCGPFLGRKAVEEFSYDPGGGHVHPDANHFVLFGAGEWLLCDDGYRAKWTGQHNTLLVDGRGQLGEGRQWFQGSQPLAVKARPRILVAESSPAVDHVLGDATEAYPADLGLRRFQRHVIFVKPDVLIVADEIATDSPRELELRFHPEQQEGKREGDAFVFNGKSAVLRLEPLTPDDAEIEAADLAAEGRHGETDQSMFAVRLTRKAAAWRNVVALSWAGVGQSPGTVRLDQQGDVVVFHCGSRVVSLDWSTGKIDGGKGNQP